MENKNSIKRQWCASLSCGLFFATSGMSYSWVTPLMVTFTSTESPVPMTTTLLSWISATVELGALIMCIPAGKLADRFGRKAVLFLSAPMCLISLAIIVMTRSVIYLFIVRLMHGFIAAVVFTAGPTYIAEISDPKIRGILGGFCQCGWQFGSLFTYIAGTYLNYNFYALACTSIPIASIMFLYFIPESPYYLLMRKKEEKTRKALKWLQHSQQMDKELRSIKEAVNKEMELKTNWKDLFATKRDIKALFLVELVCIVKYLSGCITIQIYVVEIFHDNLKSKIGSNELSIIFGLIITFVIAIGSFLSDKIGRRILLIISTVGSALLNLIIAIIYYLEEKTSVDVTNYKWITFVAMICFVVIHNIGIGPLLQIVQAEYFPTHTRSIGGAVTQTIGSFVVFVSIIQYQAIQDYFGSYLNFVVFFISSLIGSILIIILIPETTGKTLREVQEIPLMIIE